MELWVEVWDPTYTKKVGDGPLVPVTAAFSRALDDAGNGSATFAFERKTFETLTLRSIAEIKLSSANETRVLGAFVVDSLRPNFDNGTVSARGPGVLSRLADKITLPGLAYENAMVAQALGALLGLAGWTLDAEAALSDEYVSVRLAGDNVLRAVGVVCEEKGLHFRLDTGTKKQIQAGAFGANDDGLWAEYIEGDTGEQEFERVGPMRIASAELVEESNDIANFILVMGGGDGDAALTLEGADRSFVESVTANGRTHYIIRDNASIKRYGQIERRVNFKRINATDTTDAAVQFAKDALADAGKAWLDRHAVPYEKLTLDLRNVRETLNAGDKIHVRYKGWIHRNGVPYQWRDIDEEYWMMSVEEQVNADSGLSVRVDVANVDRYQRDGGDIVVGMMDAINVEHVNIQPYPAVIPWGPFQNPIDTNNDIDFRFPIFDNVVRVNSVRMIILRSVFTATGGVAEAGGDHRHLMFEYEFQSAGSTNIYRYGVSADAFGSGSTSIFAALGVTSDLYTKGASGDHTHDLEFNEVVKDTLLPRDLSVEINGFGVASGLFPDDSETQIEIDVTDAVLDRPGGVRGWHDVSIVCGSQRGDVAVVFYIDVDVSRVRTFS